MFEQKLKLEVENLMLSNDNLYLDNKKKINDDLIRNLEIEVLQQKREAYQTFIKILNRLEQSPFSATDIELFKEE